MFSVFSGMAKASSPVELANTDLYQQQNQANALREGFVVAVVDPLYNALVCAMARARHAKVVPSAEHLREQRLGKVLAAGPDGADAEAARWRLLNDPDGMALLHRHAWEDPAGAVWLARYREQYPRGVAHPDLAGEA